MPPKKGKAAKGSKKSKAKGEGSKAKGSGGAGTAGGGGASVGQLDPDSLLMQIRDLEARLARYKLKCDSLEVERGAVDARLEAETIARREGVAFLKREVERREDELAEVAERLVAVEQAREAERAEAERRAAAASRELHDTREQLTADNMVLAGKLASLEEFRVQKEELMAKFAELEEELRRRDADHSDQVYSLERKAVIDRDRLKKEMVSRVSSVASEFRRASTRQMAETTRRALRDAVTCGAQLQRAAAGDEAAARRAAEGHAATARRISIDAATQQELARTGAAKRKVIELLTERCQQLQEQLQQQEQQLQQQQELQAALTVARQQELAHREELRAASEELRGCAARSIALEEEARRERHERERLDDTLRRAAIAIRHSLAQQEEEVEEEEAGEAEVARGGRDDPAAGASVLGGRLLGRLLSLLDSAARRGLGPSPQELGPSARPASPPSGPACPPAAPLPAAAAAPAHYRHGDLGLVPPREAPGGRGEPRRGRPVPTEVAAGLSRGARAHVNVCAHGRAQAALHGDAS